MLWLIFSIKNIKMATKYKQTRLSFFETSSTKKSKKEATG
jgi:hypothetical protein